jgi:MFS family permease
VLTPSAEYEELHAPTIVATAWAFTVVRAAVGFFVFGLAFALRRTSEPAWMYAAAIGAYGIGTYAGNTIAPMLRRRFGEDRLFAGALGALAVVLAFGALGASRMLVLLVSLVLGGVASVARQGFDAMVQTHAPEATRGRAFARFETRFQLGWVAGALLATAIAIPIRYSLVILAGLLVPAAALYDHALREGVAAHVEEPFDPIEVARHRVGHAAEWHRRDRDRLAITELAGVVDLVRATGLSLDPDDLLRLHALRATALSPWPLDKVEIDWAMGYADQLVELLPPTHGVEIDVADGDAPAAVAQEEPGGTVASDVTVHSEDDLPVVSSRFDQSSSER